jgi:uncharacterized LabA/DUF88 family protein|tara:strand:- start:454 stop:1095 length:642 start_codon:yes stop_codon:yes gene_type:complete
MFSIFKRKKKVMIFIDGSNLYHVLLKNCGRSDLMFSSFGKKLTGKDRELKKIFYYNVKQELQGKIKIPEEQKKFLKSLEKIDNLEVKLGIWKEQNGSIVEKGVDVLLATDLVLNSVKNKYDTAIIVSGDGDFFPAIEAVKKEGKVVEVAAFESNISKEASDSADKVIKLRKSFFNHLWMPKKNNKRNYNPKRKNSSNNKNSKSRSNNKRKLLV